MNYILAYNKIINNSKQRDHSILDYTEEHHIKPKCLKGTDDIANIAHLTPEEHYVCHQLLIKIFPNERGIIQAANMMCAKNHKNSRNNKLYGWIRRKLYKRICFTCIHCGKIKYVLQSRYKTDNPIYCSKLCYREHTMQQTKWNIFNCIVCGKPVKILESRNKHNGKCCSRQCVDIYNSDQAKIQFKCDFCKKEKHIIKSRYRTDGDKHFCSSNCYKQYKKQTAYITINCSICGKLKTFLLSETNHRKPKYINLQNPLYCSNKCACIAKKRDAVPPHVHNHHIPRSAI